VTKRPTPKHAAVDRFVTPDEFQTYARLAYAKGFSMVSSSPLTRSSYLAGDNTKVVATDTIKNTINILAKKHLGDDIEQFATTIGEHFLGKYKHVARVNVSIDERRWQRMEP